jgi:hypothetical protein
MKRLRVRLDVIVEAEDPADAISAACIDGIRDFEVTEVNDGSERESD